MGIKEKIIEKINILEEIRQLYSQSSDDEFQESLDFVIRQLEDVMEWQ